MTLPSEISTNAAASNPESGRDRRLAQLLEQRRLIAVFLAAFEAHQHGDTRELVDVLLMVEELCEAQRPSDLAELHRSWQELDYGLLHKGTVRVISCPLCDTGTTNADAIVPGAQVAS